MKKPLLTFLTLFLFVAGLNAKENENILVIEDFPGLTCADVAWDYASRTASYNTPGWYLAYGWALGVCQEANK